MLFFYWHFYLSHNTKENVNWVLTTFWAKLFLYLVTKYRTTYFYAVADMFRIRPLRVKRHIGERAVMACYSKGDTRWYHNSSTSLPISRSNLLVIMEVRSKDEGYYFCYGLYPDGRRHFLSRIRMRVYGKLTKKCIVFNLICKTYKRTKQMNSLLLWIVERMHNAYKLANNQLFIWNKTFYIADNEEHHRMIFFGNSGKNRVL